MVGFSFSSLPQAGAQTLFPEPAVGKNAPVLTAAFSVWEDKRQV